MILQQPAELNAQTMLSLEHTTLQPLRIMLIISNLQIGGAQEVVRTLSEYFPEKGHQTVVCTFEDGPLRKEIERSGIPVEILPARKHSIISLPSFIMDMLHIRKAIASKIDKYQINIVQTQLLRGLDFLVLSLRPRKKLLVFWTFHNALFVLRHEHLPRFRWLLGFKRWAHSQLYRWTARWVNGLIVVSDDVKKALQEYVGPLDGKISVIPNSVDIRRYSQAVDRNRIRSDLGLSAEHQVFAIVATFKKQKGHKYLLEATASLIQEHPNIRLLLIGDGELRNELENQVHDLELSRNVMFLGLRTDVPKLLAASDYYILPSLWEGLPVSLVEAMACGLPIIATRVSGTKDVMLHQQTGLLVSPGDAKELGEAILYLLSHPDQAIQMGYAARKRVAENFSAEQQAESYLSIYKRQWFDSGYARIE